MSNSGRQLKQRMMEGYAVVKNQELASNGFLVICKKDPIELWLAQGDHEGYVSIVKRQK